jgi:hypothetical protein
MLFFRFGGLNSITIPGSVTSIGDNAFQGCSDLFSIYISEGVTGIGNDVFMDCSNLTSITDLNPEPQDISGKDVFLNVDLSKATLYVPAESVETYKAAEGWKAFGKIVPIGTEAQTPYIISHPQSWYYTKGYPVSPMSVAAAVSDGGTLSYQWYSNTKYSNTGGTPIAEATTNAYKPSTAEAGTTYYYVIVTNTNSSVIGSTTAADTSTVAAIVVEAPNAIELPATADGVSIYPNPVVESFYIDGITATTTVTVTDLSGRTVLTQTVGSKEPVAVGHLPSGVYIVSVNGTTVKVVKR